MLARLPPPSLGFRISSQTRGWRVLETTLSGTTEALLERKADLVITPEVPVGYSGQSLRGATLIPVAAPNHTLCFSRSDVSETELRSHR